MKTMIVWLLWSSIHGGTVQNSSIYATEEDCKNSIKQIVKNVSYYKFDSYFTCTQATILKDSK